MQYSTVMAPTLSTSHFGHKILHICGWPTGWYMLYVKNILFSLPFNDLKETDFVCSFILSKINLNCSVVLAGLSHCDLRLLLTFCYQLLQCITAWPCHTIFCQSALTKNQPDNPAQVICCPTQVCVVLLQPTCGRPTILLWVLSLTVLSFCS